jgi:hypothetical protein
LLRGPPAPPPPPTASQSLASPLPAASASASASVARPAAVVWEIDEEGKGTPLTANLDGENIPKAPCFGDRVYRGAIGKDRVTLKIAADGAGLSGFAHYDVRGAAIEVSGRRQGDSFSLDEKGAGRFDGTCDPATGRLAGDYALKGKRTAFSLAPRPLGEAAIHVVSEHIDVASPVPPHCAALGRTTETKMLPQGLCLPSDPKALAELHKVSPLGLCSFDVSAPRVFGLVAPDTERRVNAALSQDRFPYASSEMRAEVKRCPLGNETTAGGGFSIVHNANDVLSVYFSGIVSAASAAHQALIGPEPVVIDLRSGRSLEIGDVVSDEAAFRAAILACAEVIREDPEDLDWGGKDTFRKTPRWVVVPGGVAVVVGSVPPIKNGLQGTGPIASFASLAGRKLLRADSPVARLWAGVTPAAKDAPFCQAMMGLGEILAVRQRPPTPRGSAR